jgi:hypothetical protein
MLFQTTIFGVFNYYLKRKYHQYNKLDNINFFSTLFATGLGISTGIGAVIGFNPYLLSASTLSAVSLGGLCIYPPLKLQQLKAQYRKQESQKLIEP